MKLDNKLKTIKSQSNLLAKGVKNILNIEHSEKFIETIYIPFFSLFMQWDPVECKEKLNNTYVENLNHLFHIGWGNECWGDTEVFLYDITTKNVSSDLTLHARLNIYERSVYAIYGITHSELLNIKSNEIRDIKPDPEARIKLKQILLLWDDQFPDLIDLLPLTLFEGVKELESIDLNRSVKCHWLGQIYNEKYLFYLAGLKENGTISIGQPHGGSYCQIQGVSAQELAERALSDIYHVPSWHPSIKAFPNWRASRNLFLHLKYIFQTKGKINKMLVILGFHYNEAEPRFINNVTGNLLIADFYEKQLMGLSDHFKSSFDFKLYPRQRNDVLPKLDYLVQRYPDCKFLNGKSVLELSKNYDGVIHMESWSTAIIELAASQVPQYVYLGPELRLDRDYEVFLWNSRKCSTQEDFSKGCYVLIDNSSYRAAYGASFFYPFYFAHLIKRLKKRLKKRDLDREVI